MTHTEKCQIKWIDANGRPTPDENDAVAIAHHHEAIWSHPGGSPSNKIVGYNPNKISQSFPICVEHMKLAARDHLELHGWTFEPLAGESNG